MVDCVEKCKKTKRYPVLKWQDVIFHLHNKAISDDFNQFCLNHTSLSKSRCAFAVLRKYYSTTFLSAFRQCYYNPILRRGSTAELGGFVRFMFYNLNKERWFDD